MVGTDSDESLSSLGRLVADFDRSGRMDAWRVPSDPDGAAYRSNFLSQMLLVMAIAALWHLMTTLADDSIAELVLVRSIALPALLAVAARIALHELAAMRDAPSLARGLLGVVLVTHIAEFFGLMTGSEATLCQSLQEQCGASGATQSSPSDLTCADGADALSAGCIVAGAAAAEDDIRRWAYLLEVPICALTGCLLGTRPFGFTSPSATLLTALYMSAATAIGVWEDGQTSGGVGPWRRRGMQRQPLQRVLGMPRGAQGGDVMPHSSSPPSSPPSPYPLTRALTTTLYPPPLRTHAPSRLPCPLFEGCPAGLCTDRRSGSACRHAGDAAA